VLNEDLADYPKIVNLESIFCSSTGLFQMNNGSKSLLLSKISDHPGEDSFAIRMNAEIYWVVNSY
jgi:hypothetical protein